MMTRTQVSTSLVLLSIVLNGLAGCAPASTALPTPTLPAGWETYTNQEHCVYAISHPSDMHGASQDTYSWILSPTAADPSGPVPNFIYISVIPDNFSQSDGGDEIIYNYNPNETQTLLNLQVGESRSLREDPTLADWFMYTRLPNRTLSNQTAQTYENTQPWEFPLGTKEIRYYLKANGCTYLIGGYMATVGSGQLGAIDQELFDQIILTFRLAL
jgi:hypothetical protein